MFSYPEEAIVGAMGWPEYSERAPGYSIVVKLMTIVNSDNSVNDNVLQLSFIRFDMFLFHNLHKLFVDHICMLVSDS
jgi:hypothetical protein